MSNVFLDDSSCITVFDYIMIKWNILKRKLIYHFKNIPSYFWVITKFFSTHGGCLFAPYMIFNIYSKEGYSKIVNIEKIKLIKDFNLYLNNLSKRKRWAL